MNTFFRRLTTAPRVRTPMRAAMSFFILLLGATLSVPIQAQDPGLVLDRYLKASNTRQRDEFGHSVAISGDRMAIGAYLEDSSATGIDGNPLDSGAADSGAVYTYRLEGGQWRFESYIKASNTGAGDRFGWSVALDGDLLVVGAPEEDSIDENNPSDNSASNSGAAYVFVYRNRQWVQAAFLKPIIADARDRYGTAVAIVGNRIAVGAPGESSSATGFDGDVSDNSSLNSGAVYLLEDTRFGWLTVEYIKASNTGANDRFGSSVAAFDGLWLAVGAPGESSNATGINGDEDNNFAVGAGAVYLFDLFLPREQVAYVKAFNSEAGDAFGSSVAITNLDLLVGAPGEDGGSPGVNGEDNNFRDNAGAAYVYRREAERLQPSAYLKATAPDFDDAFGSAVAVDRRRIAVGARGEDSGATGVDGDDTNNGASDSGAVFTFVRSSTGWLPGQYVKAPNTDRGDGFGQAVQLQGASLLVGAPGEDSRATEFDGDASDNSLINAGAAYLYRDDAAAPVNINPGLNDAWFDPSTPGQGFFVNVFPDQETLFIAWFTYDLFLPEESATAQLGWPGHRWLTAQGPWRGDQAFLNVALTQGGVFNASNPSPQTEQVGRMTVTWLTCELGALIYELESPEISGRIPIRRVVQDNIELCETLSAGVDAP